MRSRVPMPSGFADTAEAYLAGDVQVVPPRDASTVVLVRDGRAGLEAYLLRRQPSMAFAPGMYVFPGGGVDPRDVDAAIAWAGPSPSQWAQRLGCTESLARALVAAAVRETFEESGVLLAGQSPASLLADVSDADWERDRVALESRDLSFADFLAVRGLMLRTDLLAAWTHWITPEFEPRRYDTRFFVAALPAGQRARDIWAEADRVGWMAPADAVAGVESGAMAMLPPTYVTCAELARLSSSADVLAAARSRVIEPIMPQIVREGSRTYVDAELP
jgi:8-oxo-dGTP pyrophosphatase MutT (NUDIX family)